MKAVYFSSVIAGNTLETCELSRNNTSACIYNWMNIKVSHTPTTKPYRPKIQQVRMRLRVTVKATLRKPGRVSLRPNKTTGTGRNVEELVWFLPLELSLRELVFHSSRPTGCDRGFDSTIFSWRSLFFYQCTSQISFAPLRSQGVDSRLRYILEKTTNDAPPPCSPKSIYVLAGLVSSFDQQKLRVLAWY